MAAWTRSAADHELQCHSNKQTWQTWVKHLRHRKRCCLDKFLSQPKYRSCLLIQQRLTSLWYEKTCYPKKLHRGLQCYINLRNKLSSNVKTLEVLGLLLSVFVCIAINFQITCILFGSFHSHSEFEQLLLSTQYPNAEMEVQWVGFFCFLCFFDLSFTGLWNDAAKSSILCLRELVLTWVPLALVLSRPPVNLQDHLLLTPRGSRVGKKGPNWYIQHWWLTVNSLEN